MQNEEFSKRGHERARVRSADAAVKKAVEHEAMLERKTAKKAKSTAKHVGPEKKKNSHAHTKRVSTKELYGIKVQVATADDSALADNGITLSAAGK